MIIITGDMFAEVLLEDLTPREQDLQMSEQFPLVQQVPEASPVTSEVAEIAKETPEEQTANKEVADKGKCHEVLQKLCGKYVTCKKSKTIYAVMKQLCC